jgi:hypothetical protein
VTVAALSSETGERLGDPLDMFHEVCNTIIQDRVLTWLDFDGMYARFDAIHPAHPGTFEWILDDTAASTTSSEEEDEFDLSWAGKRFVDWLAAGKGIFHIPGPPGSGKSTLLKFLCEHPKTRKELTKWAGMFPSPRRPGLLGIFRSLGSSCGPYSVLIAKRVLNKALAISY